MKYFQPFVSCKTLPFFVLLGAITQAAQAQTQQPPSAPYSQSEFAINSLDVKPDEGAQFLIPIGDTEATIQYAGKGTIAAHGAEYIGTASLYILKVTKDNDENPIYTISKEAPKEEHHVPNGQTVQYGKPNVITTLPAAKYQVVYALGAYVYDQFMPDYKDNVTDDPLGVVHNFTVDGVMVDNNPGIAGGGGGKGH